MTIRNSTQRWAHLIRRLVKFHMVGAVGIGVQLCFLFLFKTLLHMNYLLATGLAVEVLRSCTMFLWHEHFTWADRREGRSGMWRRLFRFNLTTGMISIVGNLLLMRLLVGSLRMQYPDRQPASDDWQLLAGQLLCQRQDGLPARSER